MTHAVRPAPAGPYSASVSAPPPAPRSRRRRAIHLAITVVMIATVIAGFWPYFAAGGRGPTPRPWLIHVHAAVFSGWMVLLLTQVLLVWRGRTDMHRRLGRFGIAYGVGVLLLGLVATIVAPLGRVASGEWTLDQAASFLILPIGDMILFSGFFAAGAIHRRRPEVHKRCMMLATIALMFAPAARLGGELGLAAILGIWLVPLVMAIAHDLWTRRRVHATYVIGTVVLLIAFTRVLVMESPEWIRVGRAIMVGFGAEQGG